MANDKKAQRQRRARRGRIRIKLAGRPRLCVHRSSEHIYAKQQGIEQVAFDRSGFKYHGRVKALADAAREAGLQF